MASGMTAVTSAEWLSGIRSSWCRNRSRPQRARQRVRAEPYIGSAHWHLVNLCSLEGSRHVEELGVTEVGGWGQEWSTGGRPAYVSDIYMHGRRDTRIRYIHLYSLCPCRNETRF